MKTHALAGLLFSLCLFSSVGYAESPAAPVPPAIATGSAATGDPDALKKSAAAAIKAKDWVKALIILDRYLAQKPDDALGHWMRGRALEETERFDQAIAAYRKTADLAPGDLYGWEGLCWTQILLNRPADARPDCEKAVGLSPRNYAALANLGHTWLLQGDATTAQEWYRKSLLNIDSESDLKEGPLADFDLFIGKGLQVDASRQAKAWFETEGMARMARLALAKKLVVEGLAAQQIADYVRAEPLYIQALGIYEEIQGLEHPWTGSSLNNLAELYFSLGQYARAEPLFVRALEISEKANGPGHPNTGESLNNLAVLYRSMGQYARARPLLVRALAISEKANGPEHPTTGIRLDAVAMSYQILGQYARAEPLYVRALAISEKANGPEHPETGQRLYVLGLLYDSMGHYARAEPLLVRALEISEKANGSEHPSTATYLEGLAFLYYHSLGQAARAEPLLVRALAISEQADGPEHPSTAVRLDNLAALYASMAQTARAEPLYLRALRIASLAGNPALTWSVQDSLSSFYTRTHPDLAIWYGKQAVNYLQSVRATNTAFDKETQKSFLKMNESTYKSLADLLFTQGRLMEGQQVLAMLKEAEYFDFVQRSSSGGDPRKTQATDTAQEKPWSERYKTISDQLAAMGKEFDALQRREAASLSAADKARRAKLDADLTVARKAYDAFTVELLRELGKQGGKAASREREQDVGAKQLASLSALQGTLEALGHGAVTLHYLMTDKRLWILLTTPTIQLKREAAVGEAELNRQIGRYRAAIEARDPKIKVLGKALYDILIAPVAKDLEQEKAQTLMLSLDGSLRYLPMAALFDGEKFLAQRYRLALFTEAAKTHLESPPKAQWRFAGFGLTEKRGAFEALPSVRGELEGMVAPGFTGEIKFDKQFTAESFKAGLARRPPVVHIASHFVFKPGTEADSFLMLGDGTPLSLKAIKEGNFRFTDVDLVTLSACETAVGGGKDANGREVEGFGALAQNQGAKGVIATLWPVADKSTGQFMQLFYGFRQKKPGTTKAEAMQLAQQAFIEGRVGPALAEVSRGAKRQGVSKTDHPYFWAPFILMGNWL